LASLSKPLWRAPRTRPRARITTAKEEEDRVGEEARVVVAEAEAKKCLLRVRER
jgi:hypothetical protein